MDTTVPVVEYADEWKKVLHRRKAAKTTETAHPSYKNKYKVLGIDEDCEDDLSTDEDQMMLQKLKK